jgi:hypothetical protein
MAVKQSRTPEELDISSLQTAMRKRGVPVHLEEVSL